MAPARLAHDVADERPGAQALEGQRHRGVQRVEPRQARGEGRLEEVELPRQRSCVQEALAHPRGGRPPEVLERPVPAGQLVGGGAEEPSRHARMELYAHGADRRADFSKIGRTPHPAHGREPDVPGRAGIGARIEPHRMLGEAEDEMHLTRRENVLPRRDAWRAGRLVDGPEPRHEGTQGRRSRAHEPHDQAVLRRLDPT
jgi:hypothetical protein